LGKSLEKLSSGLRINRAADDAANLGVSEKLRSQISGLDVAISNSQDGIAVIQTAEGALDRTQAILRRIRDLSEAAANGDKTDDDRAKYQAEVDQLIDEIDRISLTTEYNTKKLLNGGFGAILSEDASKLDANLTGTPNSNLMKNVSVSGTVGAKGVYTIELESAIDNTTDKVANTQYAAQRTFGGVGAAGTALGTNWEGSDTLWEVYGMQAAGGETETLTFRQPSRDKEVTVTLNDGDTIDEAIKKMQDALDSQGFEIDVLWNPDRDLNGTIDEGTFQFEARRRGSEFNFFVSGLNSSGVGNEKIVGNNPDNGTITDGLAGDDADADGIYEGDGAGNGLEATVSTANDLQVRVSDPNGTVTTLLSHSSTFKADFASQDAFRVVDDKGYHQGVQGLDFTLGVDDIDIGWAARQYRVGIDVSGVMTVQAGPNKGTDHRISIAIDDMGAQALGVTGLDVSTQEAAQNLMDSEAIDTAIAKVSSTRGNLGALQNRLEHTIKNLGVTKENLAASESRIRDADMAKEMMEFTRNQIMQQAGTAMLAQANMVNQSVLQLLG
jgi:flagellin